MFLGQGLVILSVAMQSLGKVLFGTFLLGVSTPLFILLSAALTVGVFLVVARGRIPAEGRLQLLLVNLWTALAFTSFFFALTYLPPALVASIEIGMSLIMAIVMVALQERAWPQRLRIAACIGIVTGCAALAWTEITDIADGMPPLLVWAAIGAGALTGIASAMTAIGSKKLAAAGWSPAETLAHRFYLTMAAAGIWLAAAQPGPALPGTGTLLVIGVVGAVAVLLPLLLYQIALRRVDTLSVMVCMATQPILSFLISVPSPAYEWNLLTLAGVIVVTLFAGLDVAAQRRAVAAA